MCVVVCLKVNFQVLLISRIVNVSKQLASTAGNMPQAPAHFYQRWMATWRSQENSLQNADNRHKLGQLLNDC